MGTRGLTMVIMNGEHRIAQYGQWDHYPAGQGVTILEFCRKNANTDKRREKFRAAVDKTRFVDDAEYNAMWKSVGVDIEACGGWINMEQSDRFVKKYPTINRDVGGEILNLVMNGATELRGDVEFINDSLFCEWAYVVNLDTNKLEVYTGFQHHKHNKGRYASKKFNKGHDGTRYYPCALVAEFSLNRLPTKEKFLEKMQKIADAEDAKNAD